MQNRSFRCYGIGALLLLGWNLAVMCQPLTPQDFESTATPYAVSKAPLPVEQVVKRLQERNAERAAALDQYEVTRVYHMQYRGFPSDRSAEMVINMAYHAPNSKQFSTVSESGSKFIIEHVFKRLLDGELEAANEDNRRQSALTTENYDFTLAGYESTPEGGGQYILNLTPKTKNKFLYRGKVWVDSKDFAVKRIQGEPAKNPSLWIKTTDVEHRYMKVGDFWVPAENRTQSVIRLGGVAYLSIEYKNYKIIEAKSLPNSGTVKKH
jgi:outer membrane lipoprotein-sorting protein